MRFEAVLRERQWSQRTERRTLGASAAAHILLFCFLARMHHVLQPMDVITEVSLLEPGVADAPAAAAPAAAAPAPLSQRGALREQTETKQFRRAESGRTAPDPQSDGVFEDRIQARLATLQSVETRSLAGLANVAPMAPQLATPAGLPSGTGAGSALALHRAPATGGSGGGAPLALVRGGTRAGGGELELAALPAERAARRTDPPPKAVPRQSLAGVSLAGPISDRAVVAAERPSYPDWAKKEGIEAAVTLHFVVLPDGTIKDDVLVQKTAGFADFDDNAVTALRAWRFAALPAGRTGDQWGTVTFQYRLVGGN